MALYAISDLHLSFFQDKKMDKFGDNWVNHHEKLRQNWLKMVTDADTVLIPGDISWAMRHNEAEPDLKFIDNLPGKKIAHAGNHDYWWNSTSKLNGMGSSIYFLKNSFVPYKDYAICGTRGWLCPNDSRFTLHDVKIYQREVGRMKASLDLAVANGYEKIILSMHYPPTNDKKELSGFVELIESYSIKTVIYGHLHGKASFNASYKGIVNGVAYMLVSADYLDFMPKLILQ